MSETNSRVWAFDLGKGSIGEAVRQGNKFLHNDLHPGLNAEINS